MHGPARVLDAPLEPPPRLDAVPDLDEGDRRKRRREPAGEPLERSAPRALDLARLAAVDADDRGAVGRPRDAHLHGDQDLARFGRCKPGESD